MYSFVENDLVSSVTQNIRLILTTQKGTDPHRPDFGCNLSQIQDYATSLLNVGKLKSILADCIELWEPRAIVENISISIENSNVKVVILMTIKSTGESLKEEVIYG